ncbi:type II toxin-antitoxin system VapC family toxin [Synechococcus sp. Cruz-9H2]|uniref:type II toxin-antitoxin system VapC family toxin n=1 Tax=unclassified Synechococcus TaxID=2626047 RepID=UPI0020CBA8BA|nr:MULTISPECIES: type II toxin-antitoxin system VapC family toxin [unclassified Synechococcus]MCP9820873.1 type II toxin-antitoxin system VapC family toxin [Synechococcus sp. Cruz-9H2]MCP9845108.1 type II toxin-antitoxin system VapC family toxin [Synechococcus sp. Edmonson 11F2]MCP9857278.1 type II toxin-antitoxin system VapC family toxin [Synechococcus sp. Cruz-9C9]MCP9864524.1 type II toxin-antitoxin system VapC family toxin [Synechococcus sp. Cruz-7E5]MCP9871793.1 type II toxin-antitoxin sy
MLIFCDTSALVKLVVKEEGSDRVAQAADRAEGLAVCRIAWAEAMAALAQRSRVKGANQRELQQARHALIQIWNHFAIVEINQALVEKAGTFADAFALRGYDSVQLAAVHTLQEHATDRVILACFDRRLNQAPLLMQLDVIE